MQQGCFGWLCEGLRYVWTLGCGPVGPLLV